MAQKQRRHEYTNREGFRKLLRRAAQPIHQPAGGEGGKEKHPKPDYRNGRQIHPRKTVDALD